MHILIVNHHLFDVAGGSETQCHEIALRLIKLGHKVTYAICRPGKDSYDVPYATYPLRGALPAAFRKGLAALSPDVVYWRRNKRYLLRCVMAARLHRVKLVFAVSSIQDVRPYTKRQFLTEEVSLLHRIRRTLARIGSAARGLTNYFALSLVDGIIFQHPGQLPPAFRDCHAIIYNSYPQIDVQPTATSTPYVLWVGNLKKVKNPEYFLSLATDLQDSGVDFRMAGAIQDPAYRRLLNNTRSLPSNFHFLGMQTQAEINSLMSNSLFVVSTSTDEGFPNVFIQAWLQRKTVVSLYVDPGEILINNKIGLCSGSRAAFTKDVSRLIADSSLRQDMGERGHQFAAANCNPEINVKKLETFLARIVTDGR